jgi:hypothetical protein
MIMLSREPAAVTVMNTQLYLYRIDHLSMAMNDRTHRPNMAGMILAGWHTIHPVNV